MKSQQIRLSTALLALILTLSACASPETPPSEADIQTAIAETLTAAPISTNTPTPQAGITLPPSPPTQTVTATNDPGRPLEAEVNVAFLNMRSGPSTFFEVLDTLEEGTELTATARLPENTWVQVEYKTEGADALIGWMFAEYLEFADEITQLGITTLPASQVVTGRVENENGAPIEGVLIAVISSTGDENLRADAISDNNGSFITYLPEDMFGILDIQVIGPLCGTTLMDENCQIGSHILLTDRVFISIPQGQQEANFTYETAGYTLTGTVVDNRDRPVVQINITAIRDDGAVSYGLSREDGEFYLPISEGIWEIFTVEFDPRNEGDPLTVTIADTIPEPIILKAPN